MLGARPPPRRFLVFSGLLVLLLLYVGLLRSRQTAATRFLKGVPPRDIELDRVISCTEEQRLGWEKARAAGSRSELTRADVLYENLAIATATLDSLGIAYFLMGGTLLGWARGCSIIPHTTDIDITIDEEEKLPEIRRALASHGFRKVSSFGRPGLGREESFMRRSAKLDIFVAYSQQAGHLRTPVFWTSLWNTNHKAGRVYLKKLYWRVPPSVAATSSVRFDTLPWRLASLFPFSGPAPPPPLKSNSSHLPAFRVAENWQQWLEDAYGAEWKQPVAKWDWWASPRNVLECLSWPLGAVARGLPLEEATKC